MSTLIATRDTGTAPAVVSVRRDPAPSKIKYRLQRLWLRKYVQPLVRVWMPVAALCLFVLLLAGNDRLRTVIQQKFSEIRTNIAARPEFTIQSISIPLGSSDLVRQIDGVIDLALPASALEVNLEALRQIVQNLSAVKTATVQLTSTGVLEIRIIERIPQIVWRNGNRIFLLDETGIRVAEIPRRTVRVDLPLIIGEGADLEIAEAIALFQMAEPLAERIRALVRVGQRRWDIVLDGGQIIMLPETGAITALRRVIDMQNTQNLMDWNLSTVDMRDPVRPLIRLNDNALNELRRRRDAALGEPV